MLGWIRLAKLPLSHGFSFYFAHARIVLTFEVV